MMAQNVSKPVFSVPKSANKVFLKCFNKKKFFSIFPKNFYVLFGGHLSPYNYNDAESHLNVDKCQHKGTET